MTSPRTARLAARTRAAGRVAAPRRAVAPMSVVVRGYAIPLGRIGVGFLVGVAIAGAHLSVHSLAAYKEGVKQGLRTEISRVQRANYEGQQEVEQAARAALEQFEWEGAVRLPVETVTVYQQEKGPRSVAIAPALGRWQQQRASVLSDGEGTLAEGGWYRLLVEKVREVISLKGGKRDE